MYPCIFSATWEQKFKAPMCRILFAVGSIELCSIDLLGLNTVVVGKCFPIQAAKPANQQVLNFKAM
jgi:hypothetical protein